MSQRLDRAFFARHPTDVAHDLIGCTFEHDGVGGIIVETEAYAPDDAASHSFSGRTERNASMFAAPGTVYVYFTYGMHWCVNLSCMEEGTGAAVLIRALEPRTGLPEMYDRRNTGRSHPLREIDLCNGPAKLCQALAIGNPLDGSDSCAPGSPISVRNRANMADVQVVTGPRIGISQGQSHAWRFVDAASHYLSRPVPDSA